MTREEETQSAIEWIEGLRDRWNDKDNIKYCNMAIKALEQTNALDKARAEIAAYGSICVEYSIPGHTDHDIELIDG